MKTTDFVLLLLVFSPEQATAIPQFSRSGSLTGSSFGIPGVDAEYDYVIVGGGLAGSVVAARLTERSNASVAVVEAGSFYELSNGNWSQIPYWSEQWTGSDLDDWQPLIDWGLITEPQISGKRMHYAQGKNLGGSSGRNQMMFNRPTVGAYQAWADHVGDQNWTWDSMVPFMKRTVDFSPNPTHRPSDASNSPMYNTSVFSPAGGPLHLTYPAYSYPLSDYGSQAFSSIGMTEIDGMTTGDLNGYGWWQFTIDPSTGLRSSSESSFLASAFQRPQLSVYINSQANNIIFENGAAIGVNVTNYGQRPFKISAKKEVVVSAGAWHSPQLLMVSGCGPEETLMKFGIPVVSDLPGVGQNMWDSCSIGGITYEINTTSYSHWQAPENMDTAVNELLSNASGPLTNIGLDIGAWEKLPAEFRANLSESARQALDWFPDDWPEIEYSLQSQPGNLEPAEQATKKQYGTVGAILIAPLSRGNMTIRSASNLDPPIITPNWLQNETDQEVAVQAYKRARMVWEAIPARIGEELVPGKNVSTDTQILDYIKNNLGVIHHASSSCAMGKPENAMAVVDSKGRVYGVERLRVIDSSSFPFTPPGHTQSPTYAHAEKLVQDVLDSMW